MIYSILKPRPVTVIVPGIEHEADGAWIGLKTIECIPGITESVHDIVRAIISEYNSLIIDFNRIIMRINEGRLEEARSIARRLEEALPGFDSLFTSLAGRVRRGASADREVGLIVSLIYNGFIRRLYNELARQYTVLDAGKYAIITNGPPGVFKLPGSPVDIDNLLASLSLGVIVKESIDIDVAFVNILRAVDNTYARVLLDAYNRLRPVSIQLNGLKPWIIPMIVRSIGEGHLVIIRGNRLYEYPSIRISRDNALNAFNNIISLGWI